MSRANPRFRRTNPPLPAVGSALGVVQYIIEGRLENQMTVSTFMFSAFVPNPTQLQLQTLLAAISAGVRPKYLGLVSSDWTLFREQLKVVHRNDIATVTTVSIAQPPGTRPAGHEPTEVAGIILRQTAVKGQHGRGRVSIPGVSTADVTNSDWGSVALAVNLTAFHNALVGVPYSDGTNNWQYSLGQRSTSPPRLITGVGLIVTEISTPLLGTIRRRKIGRGK